MLELIKSKGHIHSSNTFKFVKERGYELDECDLVVITGSVIDHED